MGDVSDTSESPRKPIKVKVFGRTDVGLVREHNEDNFLVADLSTGNRSLLPEVRDHIVGEEGTLLAVCDGMGGAAAGEVASQIAADTVYELMQKEESPDDTEALALRLEEAVLDAGKRIFDSAKADRSRRGMGTTITAAALIKNRIVFAQVGDSRAYLVRNGEMVQVTRDQSLVNQLIEAGQLKPEEAELFEHSNIILQALGTAEDVTVDLTYVDLKRGDTVVMCSDGLSGLVSDDKICDLVVKGPEPIDACKALTEAAREAGGHDNITVIVAQFTGEGLKPVGEEDKVEFQRLEIPGRKPFSERQQTPARPGWKSPSSDGDDSGSGSNDDGMSPIDSGSYGGHKQGTNPLIMAIAVIVVLALGVILGYLIVNGTLNASPETNPPEADSSVTPQPAAMIDCLFTADVEGTRLVIDGQDYGVLPAEGRSIALPLGLHSVEGRYGPEIVVQRRLELSEDSQPQEITLGIASLIAALTPPEPAPDAGLAPLDSDIVTDAENELDEPTTDAAVEEEELVEDDADDAEAETSSPANQRPLTKLPPSQRQPPRRSNGPIDTNPY